MLNVRGDSAGKNTKVGCHALLQGIFPTQGSNPGLPHFRRILNQLSHKGSLRILEWVAHPFSSRSSQPRSLTRVFCIASRFFTNQVIRGAPRCRVHHAKCWAGVGSLSLLQGILTTQGSNPGLPHCKQILYHLIPQGSPQQSYMAYK